ncbi:Glycoside hydrolase 2 (Mannanase, beta-galactosidase) [Elasticomyces elasticus]|nr:Glycoside hydrolase 2 (Mannanase, beta-galactosidase) [Elasticomyces elasticus]
MLRRMRRMVRREVWGSRWLLDCRVVVKALEQAKRALHFSITNHSFRTWRRPRIPAALPAAIPPPPLFAEAELEEEGFGEDEGVEDGESDDDADLEALQQAPEKLGRARKHRTVEGDVAFADSDSDLGSISEVSDQEFKEDSELKDDDETGGGKRQPYRVAELARMMYDDLLSTAQVLKRWKSEDDDSDAGAAITEDEDDDGDLYRRRKVDVDEEEIE